MSFDEPFTVTEKIDGAQVGLWITRVVADSPDPENGIGVEVEGQRWVLRPWSPICWLDGRRDNFGFASWVRASAAALTLLRAGQHFGIWYGQGISGGYGLDHRRLALDDADRWSRVPGYLPDGVEHVPILAHARGLELSAIVDGAMRRLQRDGSLAVPGQPAHGLEITPQNLRQVRFKVQLRT